MITHISFSVVTFFVFFLTSNVAQRIDVNLDDQDDTLMWEDRLPVFASNRVPEVSENDQSRLFGNLDLGYGQQVWNQEPEPEPALEFPKLTDKQKRFGVNPSDPSFYAPKMRVIGSNRETPADTMMEPKKEVTDETESAKDPFSDDVKDKKASLPLTLEDLAVVQADLDRERINDIYFTTIVAVSSALVAFIVVGAGICYHRYQRNAKAAEDVEYPAYGVTGSGRETSPTSADRKLAQNAQLYHYQHQKQQMIAFDTNHSNGHRANGVLSDNDSDEDAEEGDYTVYECPGLAPTGEMEVRNPMFDDESTPKAADSKTKK